MGADYLARVLDGAEVLLGSRDDLADVGDHSGAIGTVGAMKFLDEVEVFEMLPVKHDVVSAPDLGNAVNRKTGRLIKADAQIGNRQRDDHAVNDRPGDQVLWTVNDQPAEETRLELAMRLA